MNRGTGRMRKWRNFTFPFSHMMRRKGRKKVACSLKAKEIPTQSDGISQNGPASVAGQMMNHQKDDKCNKIIKNHRSQLEPVHSAERAFDIRYKTQKIHIQAVIFVFKRVHGQCPETAVFRNEIKPVSKAAGPVAGLDMAHGETNQESYDSNAEQEQDINDTKRNGFDFNFPEHNLVKSPIHNNLTDDFIFQTDGYGLFSLENELLML